MTTRPDVVARLRGSSRAQATAFAAACATRLEPLFAAFSRARNEVRFEQWAGQLWALTGTLEKSGAHDLQRQIESAPEASADDPNRPEYYSMRTLGVLYEAVQVVLEEDFLKAAEQCSRAAISLLRDLDYVLNIPDESTESLAGLESQAEQDWLDEDLGRADELPGDRGAEIARASDVFRRLQEVPGGIARAHDWLMER